MGQVFLNPRLPHQPMGIAMTDDCVNCGRAYTPPTRLAEPYCAECDEYTDDVIEEHCNPGYEHSKWCQEGCVEWKTIRTFPNGNTRTIQAGDPF